jgi:hypothetical protein
MYHRHVIYWTAARIVHALWARQVQFHAFELCESSTRGYIILNYWYHYFELLRDRLCFLFGNRTQHQQLSARHRRRKRYKALSCVSPSFCLGDRYSIQMLASVTRRIGLTANNVKRMQYKPCLQMPTGAIGNWRWCMTLRSYNSFFSASSLSGLFISDRQLKFSTLKHASSEPFSIWNDVYVISLV